MASIFLIPVAMVPIKVVEYYRGKANVKHEIGEDSSGTQPIGEKDNVIEISDSNEKRDREHSDKYENDVDEDVENETEADETFQPDISYGEDEEGLSDLLDDSQLQETFDNID
jgi:hypothetical protein